MANQILETLAMLSEDNIDGFKNAIKIAIAIEDMKDERITQLEKEITMLRIRLADLESKDYKPWTYYTTYTNPTYVGTGTYK